MLNVERKSDLQRIFSQFSEVTKLLQVRFLIDRPSLYTVFRRLVLVRIRSICFKAAISIFDEMERMFNNILCRLTEVC
jgi:hypothetical protein